MIVVTDSAVRQIEIASEEAGCQGLPLRIAVDHQPDEMGNDTH